MAKPVKNRSTTLSHDAEFGFTTAHISESCLRKEKDKTVPGFLYLLKKV